MRFWHYFVSSVALCILLVGLIIWVAAPSLSYSGEEEEIVTPLPEHLSLIKNDQVRILDFFKPFIERFTDRNTQTLAPTAKAVLMYDLNTNKTLFEKNVDTRVPMASLTKIMTAIIALENPVPGDEYTVEGADLVGEDSMGLSPGERLTREDLLYGLLLPSGNDAAEVLASNYPGGREAFLHAMNEKALALDLTDTRFSNPSGLQGDGVQYTTAHDLLVITEYALDHFPLFRKIVATYEHEIPATNTHTYYYLQNETNLLTTYPGVKGVKTGYTPEAGLCLVTYLDYDNHRIIGIILGSENRRQEMKDLLDYSLRELGTEPPAFDL